MTDPMLTWRSLHDDIMTMDETALWQKLDDEIKVHRRATLACRMHQRLCKLRAVRERAEIMKALGV